MGNKLGTTVIFGKKKEVQNEMDSGSKCQRIHVDNYTVWGWAMTDTYLGKPVEINEHGNNAAIKVHILDESTMKRNGFRRFINDDDSWWIFCKRVHKDITFYMTIYDSGDWAIDILDENFCQPYDYQAMYERGNHMSFVLTVMKNVNEIMDSFVHKGIISGWEVGDYV